DLTDRMRYHSATLDRQLFMEAAARIEELEQSRGAGALHMNDRMTDGQYSALVAYLKFWTPQYPDMGLDCALRDIGIKDNPLEIIDQLAKAGHLWAGEQLVEMDDERTTSD